MKQGFSVVAVEEPSSTEDKLAPAGDKKTRWGLETEEWRQGQVEEDGAVRRGS